MAWTGWVLTAGSWLKRALPGYCAFCLSPHARIEGWCDECFALLKHNDAACPRCKEPLAFFDHQASARLCGHCLSSPPSFTATTAEYLYEGAIKALVRDFKFQASPRAGTLLVELMLAKPPTQMGQALLPVPMHPDRARERGFNQAHWLAHELSRRLSLPLAGATCVKHLPSQRTLGRRQRVANLKGAFRLSAAVPAHVVIIDDVVTTGATAHELARLALDHGAERVDLWAPARTPLGNS
ncbi:ComF family protein [Halomonas sp. HMF6819]|uniref:ComF family protein n=1 Tax=Halomonas sp. HMF6819 TaxID=3373085 RepID=UPI0037AA012B